MQKCGTGTSVVLQFTPGAKIYTLVKFFLQIQQNMKRQIEQDNTIK
jgi:hypothetical protein